jgi:type IV secretory pathway TrbF-like protein
MIVLGAQPKAVPHLVQVDKLGAASRAAEREVRRPRRARCGRPSGGAGCSRRCSRT